MREPCPPGSADADDAIDFELIRKPDGSARTLTHLGDFDRRRFEAAVSVIVPALERVLGPGVLANRARVTTEGLSLEPFRAARRRYVRWMTAATASGRFRAAFVGDISDCYGSIEAATVGRSLRSLGVHDPAVDVVVEILRSFDARGVRGLPIGPPASAVLANAVLAPVDRVLAEASGGPVLRWVDDVVVFADVPARAMATQAAFSRSLRDLGLAPHPTKSATVDDPAAVLPSASRASVPPAVSRGMMRPP